MKSLFNWMFQRMQSTFTIWDYSLLKPYGFIAGLILGAYFSTLVQSILLPLVVVFSILLVRFCYLLFFKKEVA